MSIDKIEAVIVDIDGTVADCSHRKHHIEKEPKDWESFFLPELIVRDDPRRIVIGAVKDICKRLNWPPLFLTGRTESTRSATEHWLRLYSGYDAFGLWMRADGDFRGDVVVKREIYQREIEPTYDVQLVFEDRTAVVKMWRELGLETWQVAAGDF